MMTYTILGLTITIFLIVLGILFKKSKLVNILQLIWIIFIMGLNNGGGDYIGNYQIYAGANLKYTSIFNGELYKIICYFFKDFGSSYLITNCLLNAITIFVINSCIKKNTDNGNFVLSIFMIFPMFDFIMQKRAFLALTFILLALLSLFSGKRNKYLKSNILIFLASQIHSSSYFYLLVVLLYYLREKFFKEKNFDRFIYIVVITIFVSLTTIPTLLIKFFGLSRIDLYLAKGTISNTSSIAWMFIHSIFVILLRIISKYDAKLSISEKNFENNVKTLNTISLILLPLYFYESVFFRLFKGILLLNYICYANRIKNNINKTNIMYILLFLMYMLFIFLLLYHWTGFGFDILISPLFQYNEFIKWLIGG